MIYQIGICDDSPADVTYISKLVEKWAEESGLSVRLDSFSSAESFLFHYAEKKDYDILLLDIEMVRKTVLSLRERYVREMIPYSLYLSQDFRIL